jgi:hypothetical protein
MPNVTPERMRGCRAAKVDQDHGPQIERALFVSNF